MEEQLAKALENNMICFDEADPSLTKRTVMNLHVFSKSFKNGTIPWDLCYINKIFVINRLSTKLCKVYLINAKEQENEKYEIK